MLSFRDSLYLKEPLNAYLSQVESLIKVLKLFRDETTRSLFEIEIKFLSNYEMLKSNKIPSYEKIKSLHADSYKKLKRLEGFISTNLMYQKKHLSERYSMYTKRYMRLH